MIAGMRTPVVCALLAFAAGAFAQDKPALRVVVEGLGPETAACGIGRPAIESVAGRTLKAHNVAVSKDAKGAYLYLNVNAYRVMQGDTAVGCTTRLGVSVRGPVAPEPRIGAFSSKSGAYVVLCEAGKLLSGSQREMAGAVIKALEQDIKSCLAQLNY